MGEEEERCCSQLLQKSITQAEMETAGQRGKEEKKDMGIPKGDKTEQIQLKTV